MEIADSIEEYQDYYRAIIETFKGFAGFDPTPRNAVLIMFYTYDPDILIRTDAAVWSEKIKEAPAPATELKPFVSNATGSGYLSKYWTDRTYSLIKGRFSNIVDVGHPNVVAAAVDLGGYVSRYNLDFSDATAFIFNQIDSHPYLSTKAGTYKKTAYRFLKEGFNKPIKFPES